VVSKPGKLSADQYMSQKPGNLYCCWNVCFLER